MNVSQQNSATLVKQSDCPGAALFFTDIFPGTFPSRGTRLISLAL